MVFACAKFWLAARLCHTQFGDGWRLEKKRGWQKKTRLACVARSNQLRPLLHAVKNRQNTFLNKNKFWASFTAGKKCFIVAIIIFFIPQILAPDSSTSIIFKP